MKLGGRGEWSTRKEIYETWWKGQSWGAEFENECFTDKKRGHQPHFDESNLVLAPTVAL